MSLDLVEAGKAVGILVAASGGVLAGVSEIAKRRGQRFAEKKDTRVEDRNDLTTERAENDRLRNRLRDLEKEHEDARDRWSARLDAAEKRADHYQGLYKNWTARDRAVQMEREDADRERGEPWTESKNTPPASS